MASVLGPTAGGGPHEAQSVPGAPQLQLKSGNLNDMDTDKPRTAEQKLDSVKEVLKKSDQLKASIGKVAGGAALIVAGIAAVLALITIAVFCPPAALAIVATLVVVLGPPLLITACTYGGHLISKGVAGIKEHKAEKPMSVEEVIRKECFTPENVKKLSENLKQANTNLLAKIDGITNREDLSNVRDALKNHRQELRALRYVLTKLPEEQQSSLQEIVKMEKMVMNEIADLKAIRPDDLEQLEAGKPLSQIRGPRTVAPEQQLVPALLLTSA